jgi:hypothetical protein
MRASLDDQRPAFDRVISVLDRAEGLQAAAA